MSEGHELSSKALEFLTWLRDNEHHSAEWLPKNCSPDKARALLIRGKGVQKTVQKEVIQETSDFVEFPPTAARRLFQPNEKGLQALKQAGL